jgi:hypothetical protein
MKAHIINRHWPAETEEEAEELQGEIETMMTEAALALQRAIHELELLQALDDLTTSAHTKLQEAIQSLREAEEQQRTGS